MRKSEKLFNHVTKRYEKLIYYWARIFNRLQYHVNEEELFAAGLTGLWRGFNEWEPGRKKLKSFLTDHIRWAMLDEMRRNIPYSYVQQKEFRKWEAARLELEQIASRQVTDLDVAKACGIKVQPLLIEPYTDETSTNKRIPVCPEHNSLEYRELEATIKEIIPKHCDMVIDIVVNGRSQKSWSEDLNITRQAVSLRLHNALFKIREELLRRKNYSEKQQVLLDVAMMSL